MNRIRTTLFLVLSVFAAESNFTPAVSQEIKGPKEDFKNEARIAAVVNEESISESDLNARVRLIMVSSGLENTPEVKAQIRDQILKLMIDEVLQKQVTARYKIIPTEEEIETSYRNMEARNGMPKGELDRFLAAHNIPRSVLINQIKAGVAWHRYIQERYQRLIQINDKDVEKILQLNEKNKAHKHVLLAEIVLPFDSTDEEKIKTEALRLIDQLRRGANFSMVAQQVSHSASAARGGDIGWFPVNLLEENIRKAVDQMTPGQVSQPIRKQNSYHIIILREQREAGSTGTPETLITFEQALFPFAKNASEEEMEELFHRVNTISQNAKSLGMFEKLAKGVPSVQFKSALNVPLAELNPQLRELLAKLPLNKSSPPVGSDIGVLLFFISERKTVSPEAPSKEEIYRNLIEKKLVLIAQRELRELRRTAFINIRL